MRSIALKPFGKVLRDERGAAAIETAFALPVVIMFLVGAFELGGIMITETLMEGAVREASRVGMTNAKHGTMTREDTIKKIIDEGTLGFVKLDDDSITHLVYDDFASIGQPEPITVDVDGDGVFDEADGDEFKDVNGNGKWDDDMGKDDLGGPGAVVVYEITYSYPSMTGLLSPLFGDDGTIKLKASTVVRNEPFPASSGGGGGS